MREKFLKGKKVILHPLKWRDLDNYLEWKELHDFIYTFSAGGDFEKLEFKEILKNRIEALETEQIGIVKPPYSHFEIYTIDSEHIGWVKIITVRKDEPHYKEFEIIIMNKRYDNIEILKEIIELWINYVFTVKKYTRIGFATWEGNEMFIDASKKLGFIEEERIRRSVQINGKFYDRIRMGILSGEWSRKVCNAC